ncbi:MAG: DUF4476 domain-containing protein [Bacteroidales bacterium]|nr:DUF4476 domain-containing protein [Bacteroidales bacterium]MDY0141434.1 DUF4476 domain-containing protein [Bacteroidales bacterium]
MKNLITLLFLFVASFSFGQTNDIVVFSESGDNFTLFVNSIKQNQEPRANVKAKDLKGESFVLRVEFENASIPVMTKNIWTESKGIELTANIKKNKKGEYVLRYMGETPKNTDTDQYAEADYVVYEDPKVDNHQEDVVGVNTNANTETVTTTTIVTTGQVVGGNQNSNSGVSLNVNVNESGMSVTSENKKPQTNLGLSVNETGTDVSTNVGGENVNISFNINATGLDANVQTNENVSTTTTTTTTTITSSSNFDTSDLVVVEDGESNYTPVNSRCAYSMSSDEFAEAIQSVKSKSFEDSKLTTAKQICKANCMTAEQVRDMNKVFGFEDTKLEFAKYAYDFVYDSSKYYKVNDSFEFEMTIEELDEFLENK